MDGNVPNHGRSGHGGRTLEDLEQEQIGVSLRGNRIVDAGTMPRASSKGVGIVECCGGGGVQGAALALALGCHVCMCFDKQAGKIKLALANFGKGRARAEKVDGDSFRRLTCALMRSKCSSLIMPGIIIGTPKVLTPRAPMVEGIKPGAPISICISPCASMSSPSLRTQKRSTKLWVALDDRGS